MKFFSKPFFLRLSQACVLAGGLAACGSSYEVELRLGGVTYKCETDAGRLSFLYLAEAEALGNYNDILEAFVAVCEDEDVGSS